MAEDALEGHHAIDSRLKYRQTVKALLQEYARFLDDEQSNLRLLFDDERETYLLLDFGWRDQTVCPWLNYTNVDKLSARAGHF